MGPQPTGGVDTQPRATAEGLFNKATQLSGDSLFGVPSQTDPNANLYNDANIALTQPGNLTSAQRELGVDVNLNFEEIPSNENLFQDLDPALNKANDIVTKLRLKSVGVKDFTEADQKRLNTINEFISFSYAKRAELARQDEERKQAEMKQKEEAEAKALVDRAEALLKKANDSADTDKDMASIQFELMAIAGRLHMNVDDLLAKVQAKADVLDHSEVK